jgi:hypothetical protein
VNLRLIAAFIVAPAVPVLAIYIPQLLSPNTVGAWSMVGSVLAVEYAVALLIALPLCLRLARHGRPSRAAVAIIGAGVAPMPWLLWLLLGIKGGSAAVKAVFPFVVQAAAYGALAGLVGWYIAFAGRKSPTT